jgi:hypothetical protein
LALFQLLNFHLTAHENIEVPSEREPPYAQDFTIISELPAHINFRSADRARDLRRTPGSQILHSPGGRVSP